MLARKARRERQVFGDAVAARAHEGPLVSNEGEALRRRQCLLDVGRHRPQHLRRIFRSVVPVAVEIREYPRRARGARHVERLFRAIDDRAGVIAAAFAPWNRRELEADRHLPELRGWRLDSRVDEEPALCHGNLRLTRRTCHGDANERHAGLSDEGRHDLVDRLARRAGDRRPEVFRRRVAVRVRVQIGVHAFLK